MLIGFIGTGAVGKTTTATALAARLNSLGASAIYHPSVSRKVFDRYKLTEADQRRMNEEQKYDLQKAIFQEKLNQDQGIITLDSIPPTQIHILDRTPLDHFAMALYRCGAAMSHEDIDFWVNRCREIIRCYSLVLSCPLYDRFADIKDDGMRENKFGYRMCVEYLMAQCCLFHIPREIVEVLGDADLEGRLQYIQLLLTGYDILK